MNSWFLPFSIIREETVSFHIIRSRLFICVHHCEGFCRLAGPSHYQFFPFQPSFLVLLHPPHFTSSDLEAFSSSPSSPIRIFECGCYHLLSSYVKSSYPFSFSVSTKEFFPPLLFSLLTSFIYLIVSILFHTHISKSCPFLFFAKYALHNRTVHSVHSTCPSLFSKIQVHIGAN